MPATDSSNQGRATITGLLSWIVLFVLLAACFGGAVTMDRREWPQFVGDEVTYLMQAESLAHDFDFLFTPRDYHRFIDHWHRTPAGVILQSGDGGEHISYSKPLFYSIFLAPFVRFSPRTGPLAANALLLILAALAAVAALRRRLGAITPLYVAVVMFASVTFAHVYWIHADLFLMAATAMGLALVYGGASGQANRIDISGKSAASGGRRRLILRWWGAGVLLAIAGFSRPMYLVLLLPAMMAIPRKERRIGLTSLASGVVSLILVAVLINWSLAGSWTCYWVDRVGFFPITGFPDVDFPGSEWPKKISELGNRTWTSSGKANVKFDFDASLLKWNSFYFLFGRNVGVIPYFLPLLLGLAAISRRRNRWMLVPAAILAAGSFVLIRPFNFYGGGGALANRYFLPLYPAFRFIAARPIRPAWTLLTILLAAPILWPLWTAPRAFPMGDNGTGHHVSASSQRWLPPESTQRNIKSIGQTDVYHNDLWIRFYSKAVKPADGVDRQLLQADGLLLRGGDWGEILVGSTHSLSTLDLTLHDPQRSALEVRGAEIEKETTVPEAGIRYRLRLNGDGIRHTMWWRKPIHLYRLSLSLVDATPEYHQFSISEASVVRLE